MELTPNAFKRALAARKKLVGLWSQTGSATVVELLADARPDWVLIDTEHAPVDIGGVVDQLRVLDGAGVSALVRPVWNDPVVFKRLDAGAQTLLVPYVQRGGSGGRRCGDPLSATRREGRRGCAPRQPVRAHPRLSREDRGGDLRAGADRDASRRRQPRSDRGSRRR
jgi:hypothetical protein